jgi:hypothetical protein
MDVGHVIRNVDVISPSLPMLWEGVVTYLGHDCTRPDLYSLCELTYHTECWDF